MDEATCRRETCLPDKVRNRYGLGLVLVNTFEMKKLLNFICKHGYYNVHLVFVHIFNEVYWTQYLEVIISKINYDNALLCCLSQEPRRAKH